MPKVSVIIPVYNVERYLRQCMDSVVNQTLKDIEIICVNDCSPDNSIAILQEYANKDNRIKIVNLKENGGLGHARNVALEHVTGQYIMYLDSDDWLELDACEIAYRQISENNNDFVYFNFYSAYSISEKECDYKLLDVLLKQKDLNKINLKLIDEPFLAVFPCWYKIYSAKFVKENNLQFLDGINFEGRKFYLQAVVLANSVSVINKPLYNYRISRKGAITTNPKYYKDFIFAVDDVYKYVTTSGQNKNIINAYLVVHINNAIQWFNIYSQIDHNIQNDFYKYLHNSFKEINEKYNVSNLAQYIHYSTFLEIAKIDSYKRFKVKTMLNKIFSIRKTAGHKTLSILGIKISWKLSI